VAQCNKSSEIKSSQVKFYYERRSVAQMLEPRQIFSLFHQLFSDNYGFIDVGRHLWLEVESVVFRCFWASTTEPFWGLNPTGLTSIIYCLYSLDSPNLERQIPVCISPRKREPSYTPGHWVCEIKQDRKTQRESRFAAVTCFEIKKRLSDNTHKYNACKIGFTGHIKPERKREIHTKFLLRNLSASVCLED
jgi:hypothetical protein